MEGVWDMNGMTFCSPIIILKMISLVQAPNKHSLHMLRSREKYVIMHNLKTKFNYLKIPYWGNIFVDICPYSYKKLPVIESFIN